MGAVRDLRGVVVRVVEAVDVVGAVQRLAGRRREAEDRPEEAVGKLDTLEAFAGRLEVVARPAGLAVAGRGPHAQTSRKFMPSCCPPQKPTPFPSPGLSAAFRVAAEPPPLSASALTTARRAIVPRRREGRIGESSPVLRRLSTPTVNRVACSLHEPTALVGSRDAALRTGRPDPGLRCARALSGRVRLAADRPEPERLDPAAVLNLG